MPFRLLTVIFAFAAAALGAPLTWTFGTLPPSGHIAGPPGATIGWGYELENQDPANWLVVTALNADPFAHGVPDAAVFDFPVLAPGEKRVVPYDGLQGLYALTWDPAAPIGYVTIGQFSLDAEWYDGDPFSGGQFVVFADPVSSPYSAAVVPEPGLGGLVLLSAAGVIAAARARRG